MFSRYKFYFVFFHFLFLSRTLFSSTFNWSKKILCFTLCLKFWNFFISLSSSLCLSVCLYLYVICNCLLLHFFYPVAVASCFKHKITGKPSVTHILTVKKWTLKIDGIYWMMVESIDNEWVKETKRKNMK